MQQAVHYEFGPFRVEPEQRRLLREGQPVCVTPKAFDVLLTLLRNKGRLVEKSEFMSSVWADSFVEESNLTVTISMLRRILSEGDEGIAYIQTVSKRGYRFVDSVREVAQPTMLRSVAVLPFKYLSANPAYDFLKVALPGAIITRLASTGQLIVRSATAILKCDEEFPDLKKAAAEVRVDAILMGLIEATGEQLRVTVQLIRMQDDSLLWAASYDKSLREIFFLEDEVSHGVLQSTVAIQVPETGDCGFQINTANGRAYRLYLEGRYFWNKRTEDGLRLGIECFQNAVNVDPNYALAFSGLADSNILLSYHGVKSSIDTLPAARAAALRACQLNSAIAETHTSLGMVHFYCEWDWEKAEEEFQEAIKLNPNYALARIWYASKLAATGSVGQALEQVRHAEEIDPVSVGVYVKLGRLYYWNRDYSRASEAFCKAISLNRHYAPAHTRLGMTHLANHNYDAAITELKEALCLSCNDPYLESLLGLAEGLLGRRAAAGKRLNCLKERSLRTNVPAFTVALIFLGLGETHLSLEWLNKAYDDRSAYLVFAKVEPLLDPLRSEPQFCSLLSRMRLSRPSLP